VGQLLIRNPCFGSLGQTMNYIDPHIHMISRVTDDYQRMAQCGCVAVSEPAFWARFDRGSAEGFRDYYESSRRRRSPL
jgi:predicted metal-dependent TIM-barrel fold hydrolase